MPDNTVAQLKDAMLALDMDAALKATNDVVKSQSKSAVKEAVDAVTQALQVVGKRFQEGEWFLSELVYAGEVAKEVMALLSPLAGRRIVRAVLAQEGDLFVVRAVTTYPEGTRSADQPEVFHNLWLVTLAADGRAREFVEYFMLAE